MKRGLFLALLIMPALMASAQTLKPVTVVDFVHPPLAYLDAATNEPRGAEIAAKKFSLDCFIKAELR